MSKSQGFTLIELLIVMAIIGILTSIVGNNVITSRTKARDAQRKHDLNQIGRALELYMNDNEVYPPSNISGQIVGCGSDGTSECDWGTEFVDGDTVYMGELPDDPKEDTHDYYYWSNASGTEYQLYTQLQNELDAVVSKDGEGNVEYYSNTACQGSTVPSCNYGISSPNITPEKGRTLL